MNKELEKKIKQAVKLLQVCYKAAGEPLEVAYSGGKDSDVILELAKMAGVEYPFRGLFVVVGIVLIAYYSNQIKF